MRMKKLLVTILVAVSSLMLFGCAAEAVEPVTETMSVVTSAPTESVETTEVIDIAPSVGTGAEKYIVTFTIRQTHFTLNPFEHMKDNMNKIEFEVPVDKEYYDSVTINQVINDDFRFGSLVMHGSFGNWKVTISDKQIVTD